MFRKITARYIFLLRVECFNTRVSRWWMSGNQKQVLYFGSGRSTTQLTKCSLYVHIYYLFFSVRIERVKNRWNFSFTEGPSVLSGSWTGSWTGSCYWLLWDVNIDLILSYCGRFPSWPRRQTEALQTLHCGLLRQLRRLQVRPHLYTETIWSPPKAKRNVLWH